MTKFEVNRSKKSKKEHAKKRFSKLDQLAGKCTCQIVKFATKSINMAMLMANITTELEIISKQNSWSELSVNGTR